MTGQQYLEHGGRDIGEVFRQSVKDVRFNVVERDHQHAVSMHPPRRACTSFGVPTKVDTPRRSATMLMDFLYLGYQGYSMVTNLK